MKQIIIDAMRTGYAPDQVHETMTVSELIEYLEELRYEGGDDVRVYLSFDNGYTYGGITSDSFLDEEPEYLAY